MSGWVRDEQLCDHDKRSSVRIDCAPLFHEFEDGSRGVQEDETLAEEVQVYDVAWDDSEWDVGRGSSEERQRQRQRRTIAFSPVRGE
jgi:hypothetical protein